jgi:hypothetical protein
VSFPDAALSMKIVTPLSRLLFFTQAGNKCSMSAVKSCRVVIFFRSFGFIESRTINVEDWIQLKPVLGRGVRDVAPLHCLSRKDSYKPGLQFSHNIVVFVASDGSPLSRFWIYHLNLPVYFFKHSTGKCFNKTVSHSTLSKNYIHLKGEQEVL